MNPEGVAAPPNTTTREAAKHAIRHAVVPCTLGWVIIAASRKGICAIEFDESAQALEARIRARFSQPHFEPVDAEFEQWTAQVLGYIERPHGVFGFPLDAQGTIFQHRVWLALQAIPAGQTASYAEIAERIGQPRAFRAVAHSCAGNPVAVAIPCHRAVRPDGTLAGYRWGLARKVDLLRRENEPQNKSLSQDSDKKNRGTWPLFKRVKPAQRLTGLAAISSSRRALMTWPFSAASLALPP